MDIEKGYKKSIIMFLFTRTTPGGPASIVIVVLAVLQLF